MNQPTRTESHNAFLWPALSILTLFVALVAILRLEGRIWYCAQGDAGLAAIWSSDIWSSHCSQHILDPYSITHMSHGLIFWCLLAWLAPKMKFAWKLVTSMSIAALWEVAENSAFVINRYRSVTMSLDYLGDSVTNATADVLCCGVGVFVARALGVWKTLALFAATEIILLFAVRDNLTLNCIMLIYPVEAIKAWQTTGH